MVWWCGGGGGGDIQRLDVATAAEIEDAYTHEKTCVTVCRR